MRTCSSRLDWNGKPIILFYMVYMVYFLLDKIQVSTDWPWFPRNKLEQGGTSPTEPTPSPTHFPRNTAGTQPVPSAGNVLGNRGLLLYKVKIRCGKRKASRTQGPHRDACGRPETSIIGSLSSVPIWNNVLYRNMLFWNILEHIGTRRNKGIPSAPADAPLVVWPR